MSKLEIPNADASVELVRGSLKPAMASAGATNPHRLWMVPRDQIRIIPDFNVRIRNKEYEAHINFLEHSISQNGYDDDKPLTGYVAKEDGQDVIYLTDGHSRIEAVDRIIAKGTQFEALPIIIKPNGTSMEDLTVALGTGNSGRSLTPLELGIVVKRLMGYGMTEDSIARRLTLSRKYVDDLLTLVAAPKAVRDMIASGRVSSTLALQTLAKHGKDAATVLKEAVKTAEAGGKKKATAKHVKGNAKPKAPREIDSTEVLDIAAKCGFPTGTFDDKLVTFAASLLDKFGVEVFQVQPETPEVAGKGDDDPADDL